MLRVSLLDELLEEFLKEVPELTAVLVVDIDGLIIAQKSLKGFDEEIVGAIMTILDQTLNRIKRFADTSFGSGMFDTNEFRLFYAELANSNALFVLVADPYCNIEQYIPYSYIFADKASQILNNREPTLDTPRLDRKKYEIAVPENSASGNKIIFKKICVIGPQKTGKTSLLDMYISGEYQKEYRPTVGVSFIEKNLQITNRFELKFYIFDLAGLKSFGKVRRFYYPDSHSVILLFDYSKPETLDNLNEWIEEAKHFIKDNSIPFIIVGNKIDLVEDREELRNKAQSLAAQYSWTFFETSAKTGEGIDELFTNIVSFAM